MRGRRDANLCLRDRVLVVAVVRFDFDGGKLGGGDVCGLGEQGKGKLQPIILHNYCQQSIKIYYQRGSTKQGKLRDYATSDERSISIRPANGMLVMSDCRSTLLKCSLIASFIQKYTFMPCFSNFYPANNALQYYFQPQQMRYLCQDDETALRLQQFSFVRSQEYSGEESCWVSLNLSSLFTHSGPYSVGKPGWHISSTLPFSFSCCLAIACCSREGQCLPKDSSPTNSIAKSMPASQQCFLAYDAYLRNILLMGRDTFYSFSNGILVLQMPIFLMVLATASATPGTMWIWLWPSTWEGIRPKASTNLRTCA